MYLYVYKVGDKKFTTFSDAVEESEKTKGGAVITLLANADAPYSMNNLTLDVLRVKHSGYSADITDYNKKETNKGITYYFRTDDKVYVDGTGDDDDNVEIAAGVAATVIVVGTGVEVVLGAGASVVVEGAAASSVNVDVSDSESECLEEEEQEDGSKKYTNHKFHWVTIDTGISILDAGAEVMPDCVNDIWATYNQNIATIVKILPPVLTVIGYTDVILKFPYPEGWFFPPIPYLPEAMNPGSHFVAFFEGAGYSTYGTPFVGKTITEDLEITGVWVPYEAAVIKDNGDREYYLQFSEAAEKRDGKIVEILSAPLFNYTRHHSRPKGRSAASGKADRPRHGRKRQCASPRSSPAPYVPFRTSEESACRRRGSPGSRRSARPPGCSGSAVRTPDRLRIGCL